MHCADTARIAVCKGDGVGPEVISEAEKVLRIFLPDADYFEVELGYAKWQRTGNACTDEDISELKSADAILFGAVTTPPELNYKSVLLQIRHELDLYANIRPIRVNNADIDIMIVRENTEGLYSGIEECGVDRSTTLRVVTRIGSERIAKVACDLASGDDYFGKPLVIGNKANVLKSDQLFKSVCEGTAKKYGIDCKSMFIDALCLDVLMNPKKYGVIVTTNIFGDILSDACGYLAGGLGMLPSANIGSKYAFFEPVHGSAPDIAGCRIANPTAAIRSVEMLLDYLGMKAESKIIENAILGTIRSNVRTQDLGGSASTEEFGECVRRLIKAQVQPKAHV